MNSMYIYLFFSIGYNIFTYLVYIMSSVSEVVKNQFQAQFNLVLLQSLKTVENNTKGIEPLVICKRRQAITDAEKKIVQDYYFDLRNGKLVYKHIQE